MTKKQMVNYLKCFLLNHAKLYFYFMGFWLLTNAVMITTSFFIDCDLLTNVSTVSSILAFPVVLIPCIFIYQNREPK